MDACDFYVVKNIHVRMNRVCNFLPPVTTDEQTHKENPCFTDRQTDSQTDGRGCSDIEGDPILSVR